MSDLPENIWAQPSGMFGAVRVGTYADAIRHAGGAEYVRADLVSAQLAALTEWKEARRAAVEEGATPDRFARLAEAEAGLLKVAPMEMMG